MIQKYGLWAAIAGIFLLAILGVRSAATWLSETTPEPESNITVGSNRVLNEESSNRDSVFNSNREASQRDIRVGDRNTTDTRANELAQVTNTFSPLEEAGTYIQRQKRVERDPVVAASTVTINAVANNTPTAAASDTRVSQPGAASNTQATQPSSTAPASQAVPALW
ncbi:MAG: hypothetical protein ABG776_06425 [Cyanobacteria bacterium J06555_13]